MKIHVRRQQPQVVSSIEPGSADGFLARGVFVMDDTGSVIWGIVPAAPIAQPRAGSERRFEVRGGTHTVFTADRPEALPPPVRDALARVSATGHPLSEIRFAVVPESFEQIVPEFRAPTPLERGRQYQLYVIGSESDSISFRM